MANHVEVYAELGYKKSCLVFRDANTNHEILRFPIENEEQFLNLNKLIELAAENILREDGETKRLLSE